MTTPTPASRRYDLPIPDREPDGKFSSFQTWVWMNTPTPASCPLAPKDEAERLRNLLSIVYGLLWPVPVDRTTEAGERVAQARRWCLQELSKELQGEGIADANTIIHAREPAPPFNRRPYRDRLTQPDPNS